MATMTIAEAEAPSKSSEPKTKFVYSFGGGRADGDDKMKAVLGGKGGGLAEMTNGALPVPLVSPRLPNTIACTLTAVPSMSSMLLMRR